MSRLAENLMYAWLGRGERAAAELEAGDVALVKPARVVALQVQVLAADAWSRFWLGQVAA